MVLENPYFGQSLVFVDDDLAHLDLVGTKLYFHRDTRSFWLKLVVED